MKKLIVLLCVVSSFFVSSGLVSADSTSSNNKLVEVKVGESELHQVEELKLSLKKLDCACKSKKIEMALQKNSAVRFAKVDFNNKALLIKYSKNKGYSKKIASEVVERFGVEAI